MCKSPFLEGTPDVPLGVKYNWEILVAATLKSEVGKIVHLTMEAQFHCDV